MSGEPPDAQRRPGRPGGMAPPAIAELPDGTVIELQPLAEQICELHLRLHPEDVARYGRELAREWCVHDNQHMLAWAIEDRDLRGQVAWLAGVLDARGYPVANLVDNVLQAAHILDLQLPAAVAEPIARRMREAVADLGGGTTGPGGEAQLEPGGTSGPGGEAQPEPGG